MAFRFLIRWDLAATGSIDRNILNLIAVLDAREVGSKILFAGRVVMCLLGRNGMRRAMIDAVENRDMGGRIRRLQADGYGGIAAGRNDPRRRRSVRRAVP